MNYGPFRTKEASDVITKFLKDELLPLIREIGVLAIEIFEFKADFFDSYYSSELNDLETEFRSKSTKFIRLYHRWETPDELFKDCPIENDPGKIAPVMLDYMNFQNAIQPHFREGFLLLENISKIMTSQRTASYNRITITIATIALVIAIISIIR